MSPEKAVLWLQTLTFWPCQTPRGSWSHCEKPEQGVVPWALTQLRGPLGEGQEGREGQQKAVDLLPVWPLPATPWTAHMHRLGA